MLQTKTTGTNSSEIKLHNLSAILTALLYNEGISRVGLAQRIGVSTATITNLVTELVEQGYIAEVGVMKRKGQASVGRPRRALKLIPNARYALGVHIDVERVYVTLTNIRCEILQMQSFQHEINTPWHLVMNQVCNLVDTVIAAQGISKAAVVGLGVAASGLVDPVAGVNVIAPNLGWHDVPIGAYLHGRLQLPVIVENNVRAMALGEAMFGIGRQAKAMAFIYAGIGVGAGLVVDGSIYRGVGAGAGEVGHTFLIFAGQAAEKPVLHSLESLIAKPAILHAAQEAAAQNPQSLLAQAPELNLDALFDAAAAHDESALRLLDERAFYTGIALANLVNVLNPELIVLGGLFTQERGLMLPTIEKIMREYAFANLGDGVRIQPTGFGQQAGMMGAAALALDYFFYRPQAAVRLS